MSGSPEGSMSSELIRCHGNACLLHCRRALMTNCIRCHWKNNCQQQSACTLPHSVQETGKGGSTSGDMLNTDVQTLSVHELKEEEDQVEEDDPQDEDLKAPLELIMEFLRAVRSREFQLAHKLCQMILIYEPDNPEASEFLPLIQKKLLQEQEAEQSHEEDEDREEDDDSDCDDHSGSDEASSSLSSSSCSSSSSSDDDDDDEKET